MLFTLYYFPFQPDPRVSVGMELEIQLFPKGFQLENVGKQLQELHLYLFKFSAIA